MEVDHVKMHVQYLSFLHTVSYIHTQAGFSPASGHIFSVFIACYPHLTQ